MKKVRILVNECGTFSGRVGCTEIPPDYLQTKKVPQLMKKVSTVSDIIKLLEAVDSEIAKLIHMSGAGYYAPITKCVIQKNKKRVLFVTHRKHLFRFNETDLTLEKFVKLLKSKPEIADYKMGIISEEYVDDSEQIHINRKRSLIEPVNGIDLTDTQHTAKDLKIALKRNDEITGTVDLGYWRDIDEMI